MPIQVISPLPGCSSSTDGTTKGARPKKHSEILTSIPMKERLEEKRKKNEEKSEEKRERKGQRCIMKTKIKKK